MSLSHLHLREASGSRACPFCRAPIRDRDETWTCAECLTVHHADCVRENGACTIMGCGKHARADALDRWLGATPRRRARADLALRVTGIAIMALLPLLIVSAIRDLTPADPVIFTGFFLAATVWGALFDRVRTRRA